MKTQRKTHSVLEINTSLLYKFVNMKINKIVRHARGTFLKEL